MVADQASNPFVAAAPGTAGQGLNPLLLHPAMVSPSAGPVCRLRRPDRALRLATGVCSWATPGRAWAPSAQRWAVAGWLFLSLGIGLGAWWAYVVLSWGGYWGWDPVENTSLVPWLTATALLHSLIVYRRRGLLPRWTLALACATFWCTIVATWTTRTGLVSSVHAFQRNETLVVILSGLVIVVAVVSVALLAARWRRFDAAPEAAAGRGRRACPHRPERRSQRLAAALLLATVVVPLVAHAPLTRRLSAVRPAARSRGGWPLSRSARCSAGRARRARRHGARCAFPCSSWPRCRAAGDRRLALEPLRPDRPRGLLSCRRGPRLVDRGRRAAGRR